MKATRLFKSFVAFKVEAQDGRTMHPHSVLQNDEADVDMLDWSSGDPGGQQWESIGLHSGAFGFGESEFFRDIDGAGTLCFIRLSKRALPARVVREKVDAMAADIYAQTGRKPSRKERRDLQDDATMQLLPKAFINHVIVPVVFTSDGLMLIFTSTPKRYESILSYMWNFFREAYDLELKATYYPMPKIAPVTWMTSKAIALRSDELDEGKFSATDFAVMKGDEIGMIRVKDRELGCAEVSAALKSGYRIEQIALVHTETFLQFRLNLNLAFTSVRFSDDVLGELRENMGEDVDEVQATAWLVISEYRKMLADLVVDMGGEMYEDDEL